MNTYKVTYTPDKKTFCEVIISAVSLTKAYLAFLQTYPTHYEITEIEQCPAEA